MFSRMKTIVLLLALSLTANAQTYSTKDIVPGELLVLFKSFESMQNFQLQGLGLKNGKQEVVYSSLPVLKISFSEKMRVVKERLERDENIEIVEPNFRIQLDQAPDDKLFPEQWSIANTGQVDRNGNPGKIGADIGALEVWNRGITGNKRVIVAVIDSGVDWDHPDLKSNLYTNPREIPGNGRDDDRNGFVDDVHGWNFHNKNNNSNDGNGHGTHVAGIIGAQGNNGLGIAGVAWEISLLPIKFLGDDGSGDTANAISGLHYATKMGAKITNNSWSSQFASRIMEKGIKKAAKSGVLFVAASGNRYANADVRPRYPGAYNFPNVLSVGATTNADLKANFSNYGYHSVDVLAPGDSILSTVPGGYEVLSGTSMATPIVSGIAGLLLSQNPSWTYKQLKKRIMNTVDTNPEYHYLSRSHGRVNLRKAIDNVRSKRVEPELSWSKKTWYYATPHPYKKRVRYAREIRVRGAKSLKLFFSKIRTTPYLDQIDIKDSTGRVVTSISGAFDNLTTQPIEGDTATLVFKANPYGTDWGFQLNHVLVGR